VTLVCVCGYIIIGLSVKNKGKQQGQSLKFATGHESLFAGVSGRVSYDHPLAPYNRLRVGGPAQIFFRPADLSDLITVLRRKPQTLPHTSLGMGSNVLIRDGGVPGLVIQLGKGFTAMSAESETLEVEVGAGASQYKFAQFCAREGIGGLEFFCGIPGTIGGALRMNAGAHGVEVKDRLISATVLDDCGGLRTLGVNDLKYSYRNCGLPKVWIFISAKFQGKARSRAEIRESIEAMLKYREEKQPVNDKTVGCTFANPGHGANPAWKLIMEAGCQGLRLGDAQVSEKHANFLINTKTASAQEIESLGNLVQKKVLERTGLTLRWEVERIGEDGKGSSLSN
jgi:UDP-N-acetylmuramate dehydrogenase